MIPRDHPPKSDLEFVLHVDDSIGAIWASKYLKAHHIAEFSNLPEPK